MKQLFILFICLLPLSASAQFFNFGFGDDRYSQREQETVTKPEYKGGTDAINKYLKKNFRNPPMEKKLDGKVVVACILNEKGKVMETHIVQGMGEELNDEAQRVCKKMKFKPAKRGKTKVKSRFDIVFPIRRSRLSFSTLQTVDL
jgi:TonB family protein